MELITANITGKVRRERLNGKEYLVAPMSLIVPGVLNGSRGRLYYPPEENARYIDQWNDKPLVVYHPVHNGRSVSARSKSVITKVKVGRLYNASITKNGVLHGEGWFDEEATRRVDKRVLDALNNNTPMEISTGLYTDTDPAEPDARDALGRPYDYIARNYRADHIAILPDQRGACSLEDGCGLLVTHNAWQVIGNARKDEDESEGGEHVFETEEQRKSFFGKVKAGEIKETKSTKPVGKSEDKPTQKKESKDEEDEKFNAPAIAKMLGVGAASVRKWAERGKLPMKDGKIGKKDLNAFLHDHGFPSVEELRERMRAKSAANTEKEHHELRKAESEQKEGSTPTRYSRSVSHNNIRQVKPSMSAGMGERVKLSNGQVWEYKGISGYGADNRNRVNGWELVRNTSWQTLSVNDMKRRKAKDGDEEEAGKEFESDEQRRAFFGKLRGGDIKETKRFKPIAKEGKKSDGPQIEETPGHWAGKYKVGDKHFTSRKAAQEHIKSLSQKKEETPQETPRKAEPKNVHERWAESGREWERVAKASRDRTVGAAVHRIATTYGITPKDAEKANSEALLSYARDTENRPLEYHEEQAARKYKKDTSGRDSGEKQYKSREEWEEKHNWDLMIPYEYRQSHHSRMQEILKEKGAKRPTSADKGNKFRAKLETFQKLEDEAREQATKELHPFHKAGGSTSSPEKSTPKPSLMERMKAKGRKDATPKAPSSTTAEMPYKRPTRDEWKNLSQEERQRILAREFPGEHIGGKPNATQEEKAHALGELAREHYLKELDKAKTEREQNAARHRYEVALHKLKLKATHQGWRFVKNWETILNVKEGEDFDSDEQRKAFFGKLAAGEIKGTKSTRSEPAAKPEVKKLPGKDDTKRLVEEVERMTYGSKKHLRAAAKGSGKETDTERKVVEKLKIPEEGLSLGYVSNPITFSNAFRYLKNSEHAALVKAIKGGRLHIRQVYEGGKDNYRLFKGPTTNAQPSDEADVSPDKACKILKDGSVHGQALTEKQRGMFGAICGKRTDNAWHTLNYDPSQKRDEQGRWTSEESAAVKGYTNLGYSKLNKALREGKPLDPESEKIHKGLQSILKKTKPLDTPIDVVSGRQVPASKLSAFMKEIDEAHKTGKTLSLPGYVSTSKGSKVDVDFSDATVVFRGKARHGIDVGKGGTNFGSKADEGEFILPHGAKYRVKGVTKGKGGMGSGEQYFVDVEQVIDAPQRPLWKRLLGLNFSKDQPRDERGRFTRKSIASLPPKRQSLFKRVLSKFGIGKESPDTTTPQPKAPDKASQIADLKKTAKQQKSAADALKRHVDAKLVELNHRRGMGQKVTRKAEASYKKLDREYLRAQKKYARALEDLMNAGGSLEGDHKSESVSTPLVGRVKKFIFNADVSGDIADLFQLLEDELGRPLTEEEIDRAVKEYIDNLDDEDDDLDTTVNHRWVTLNKDNCGIGKGGFQPGNDCAKGGGGGAQDTDMNPEAGGPRTTHQQRRQRNAAQEAYGVIEPLLHRMTFGVAPTVVGIASGGKAGGRVNEEALAEAKDVFKGIFSRLTLGIGPLVAKGIAAGIRHSPKAFKLLVKGLQAIMPRKELKDKAQDFGQNPSSGSQGSTANPMGAAPAGGSEGRKKIAQYKTVRNAEKVPPPDQRGKARAEMYLTQLAEILKNDPDELDKLLIACKEASKVIDQGQQKATGFQTLTKATPN